MKEASPQQRLRPPTSVDIAREAGVSQATVSRAFNGGRVSDETRRRVLVVAQQLNYTPNAMARGLVTNRTGLIGVVVADITNPFYPELLESLGAHLAARGRHMLLQNAAPSAEEAAVRLLVEQRVDGIIFTTASSESHPVRSLANRGFPVVLSNRIMDATCDAVDGDNAAGGGAVAEHLFALGHRRVASIEGDPKASTSAQRMIGFERRLSELGVRSAAQLRVEAGFSYDRAYSATTHLLALANPPTAIFCHNDWMAFAALNAARAVGVRVPQDLSVVGFDDIREAAWESFALTTVNQPIADMAAASVTLLEERVADRTIAPRRITFPCRLIERHTTGPVPHVRPSAVRR